MQRHSDVGHHGHEQRRLPRIKCSQIGSMDVRGRPASLGRYRGISVAIRSVSVGGVGLVVLDERLDALERGALVALHIGASGLNMPGHVAWTHNAGLNAPILELGIQLMLLGTPPWTRMRYSAWVDDVVSASRAHIEA